MDQDWIWSRYWQYDRVASCMDGAGVGNYAEEVAAGWRRFFEELPPQSRVIDLCTGNGAIALIAAQVARRKENGMAIVGVDRAAIDPGSYVNKFREDLDRIDFRAGVEAEELPFPDESASAIVSQYGIEYSDMERSIAEAARVLAPSGRIRFVLHAAEGVVAAGAVATVRDADFLLREIDLPGAAAECLSAVLAVERGSPSQPGNRELAEESVARFQAALAAAEQYMASATEPAMIHTAGSVLADTYSKRGYFDLPQLLAKVEEVRTEIMAHKGRSSALVEAAVGRKDLGRMSERLRSAGVPEVSCSPLTKDDRLIGYVLEGSRPA
ncbi:MAG TPA: methyltransferase domain-containing protein [Allosphingosinicella sp.]|nr:methyltransferase domain-containing protein [Allosphingosinicella sp.]